jgi:hypothetical protein
MTTKSLKSKELNEFMKNVDACDDTGELKELVKAFTPRVALCIGERDDALKREHKANNFEDNYVFQKRCEDVMAGHIKGTESLERWERARLEDIPSFKFQTDLELKIATYVITMDRKVEALQDELTNSRRKQDSKQMSHSEIDKEYDLNYLLEKTRLNNDCSDYDQSQNEMVQLN